MVGGGGGGSGVDRIDLTQGLMLGTCQLASCESGSETSGSVKCGEFLD